MHYKEVDLSVALRAISYHRMNIARKLRREMKREKMALRVLQEKSELDSALYLVSHNVYQMRAAFRKIAKLEKRIKARKERAKKPMDHLAGRNQGNFSSK